jgi:hypothetical protein
MDRDGSDLVGDETVHVGDDDSDLLHTAGLDIEAAQWERGLRIISPPLRERFDGFQPRHQVMNFERVSSNALRQSVIDGRVGRWCGRVARDDERGGPDAEG